MADDLLLKPKERERLAKVRALLASHESPYAHITNGGASPDLNELKGLARPKKDRSESQTMSLEAKWQSGYDPDQERVTLEDVDLGPSEPKDPSKFTCSFCKCPVDQINATHGKGRLNKVDRSEVLEIDGKRVLRERTVYFVPKIVACPACCLKIKPHLDKHGHITSQGIDVPNSD